MSLAHSNRFQERYQNTTMRTTPSQPHQGKTPLTARGFAFAATARTARRTRGNMQAKVKPAYTRNHGQQKGWRWFQSFSGWNPQSSVRGGKLFTPSQISSEPPTHAKKAGSPRRVTARIR